VTAAVIAGSAGAGVIAVCLLVWWVARMARVSAERLALYHNALRAGISLEESLAREKAAHDALRTEYTALAATAVAHATDAGLVALAGGDPGPGVVLPEAAPADGIANDLR
jgi:hypothetical protein